MTIRQAHGEQDEKPRMKSRGPFGNAPFDFAQGKPFDFAQGKPFDFAQGKQGRPFDFAQGRRGRFRKADPMTNTNPRFSRCLSSHCPGGTEESQPRTASGERRHNYDQAPAGATESAWQRRERLSFFCRPFRGFLRITGLRSPDAVRGWGSCVPPGRRSFAFRNRMSGSDRGFARREIRSIGGTLSSGVLVLGIWREMQTNENNRHAARAGAGLGIW